MLALVAAVCVLMGAFVGTFSALAADQPTAIVVLTPPTKNDYLEGDRFEPKGMVVQLQYAEGEPETVQNYAISDDITKAGEKIYVIWQLSAVRTIQAEVPITIRAKTPTKITVTHAPNKTAYIEEQLFDKAGLTVRVDYDNGTSAAVTNFAVPSAKLTTGSTSATISYTENGQTVTTTTPISVRAKALTQIAVTAPPSKTGYIEDEVFNKSGMVVTATYDNGTSGAVTAYTVPTAALTTATKSVTISYTHASVTKTTTQAITVSGKKPTALSITAKPAKVQYVEDEKFDKTGLVVTATYNNGKSAAVTAYTVPTAALKTTDTAVTVSYALNGATATASIPIAVTPKPTGITLSASETLLAVGQTLATSTVITPGGAASGRSYASSNTAVATVDAAGKISAKAAGTATITVTTTYNNQSAKLVITVKPALKDIAFKAAESTLGVGEINTPALTLTPADAKAVRTYISSDESIATVDASGKVTAVAAGTATITVTSYNNKTATQTVTVLEALTDLAYKTAPLTLGVGEEATTVVTLAPKAAKDSRTYTSLNKKVATVDASGVVTAVGVGTTTIKVQSYNSLTDELTVTVLPAPTALAYKSTAVTLGVGEKYRSAVTITPTNARDKRTYTSANKKIATVDADGVVTAVGVGTVTIKVQSYNKLVANLTVTVKAVPTKIAFKPASITLGVGEKYSSAVTLTPAAAKDKRTYKSDNEKIATVDSAGRITAKGVGKATITVTTYNELSAKFTVTVKAAPTKIAYKVKSVTLGVGEKYATAVTLTPAAAQTTRTYKSANSKIATVDSAGRITAKGVGKTTITVTTYNKKPATFTVTVKAAPSKVTISKTTAKLAVKKTLTLKSTLPANTASAVTWESNNEKVATVSAKGVVTAKKKGTAIITVKLYNGKKATCKVTVT